VIKVKKETWKKATSVFTTCCPWWSSGCASFVYLLPGAAAAAAPPLPAAAAGSPPGCVGGGGGRHQDRRSFGHEPGQLDPHVMELRLLRSVQGPQVGQLLLLFFLLQLALASLYEQNAKSTTECITFHRTEEVFLRKVTIKSDALLCTKHNIPAKLKYVLRKCFTMKRWFAAGTSRNAHLLANEHFRWWNKKVWIESVLFGERGEGKPLTKQNKNCLVFLDDWLDNCWTKCLLSSTTNH